MTPEQVGRITLEWWRANGPRNLSRLGSLSDHMGMVYGLEPDVVRQAAWAGIQEWEKEEMQHDEEAQP